MVLGKEKQLYHLARGSVLRNSGRYLVGVYLLGAIGDPDICSSVWNALRGAYGTP
jgi:hypothetical protein